jgi:hypothetical protein
MTPRERILRLGGLHWASRSRWRLLRWLWAIWMLPSLVFGIIQFIDAEHARKADSWE